MAELGQMEIANGQLWFQPGEDIPNIDKKLFALKNLCTDCKICEMACSLAHSAEGELNPIWTRLKVEHAPEVTPRIAKDGFGFMPAICHHCANPPPCAEVCPTDAFYYDPITYAAIIDQNKCIQCMECVPACPFGTVYVAPTGEVLKCDLCGGDPVCVKACATRPEMINAGKQYPRLPVLFHEDKATYSTILRQKPEAKKEVGLAEAMLKIGEVSSAA